MAPSPDPEACGIVRGAPYLRLAHDRCAAREVLVGVMCSIAGQHRSDGWMDVCGCVAGFKRENRQGACQTI